MTAEGLARCSAVGQFKAREGAGTSLNTGARSRSGAADLWTFLAGQWHVSRRLIDRASEAEGSFEGTAQFKDDAGTLVHHESGVLVWPGRGKVPASRQLRWLPSSSWAADICFDDGRPFHHLDMESGTDHPVHDCLPDVYRGHFEILGPDEWLYQWEVAGPQKNLLLSSRLTRAPSGQRTWEGTGHRTGQRTGEGTGEGTE